jgi:hypothetical protein
LRKTITPNLAVALPWPPAALLPLYLTSYTVGCGGE